MSPLSGGSQRKRNKEEDDGKGRKEKKEKGEKQEKKTVGGGRKKRRQERREGMRWGAIFSGSVLESRGTCLRQVSTQNLTYAEENLRATFKKRDRTQRNGTCL